jgi:hypothetical protein
MSRFPRDETMAQIRALNNGRDRGPRSPANFFGRLGVLLLVALCFGFAAQFLVGAP